MAATKANLEAEFIGEFGPMMSVVGLDAVTMDGSNASLESVIRKAVVSGGGSIADPPSVTDDDIATATATFDTLVLLGKLALLDKLWGNWPHVDMKSGEESQALSQLAKRLQEKMQEIKEELADPDSPLTIDVAGLPVSGIIEEGSSVPHFPIGY